MTTIAKALADTLAARYIGGTPDGGWTVFYMASPQNQPLSLMRALALWRDMLKGYDYVKPADIPDNPLVWAGDVDMWVPAHTYTSVTPLRLVGLHAMTTWRPYEGELGGRHALAYNELVRVMQGTPVADPRMDDPLVRISETDLRDVLAVYTRLEAGCRGLDETVAGVAERRPAISPWCRRPWMKAGLLTALDVIDTWAELDAACRWLPDPEPRITPNENRKGIGPDHDERTMELARTRFTTFLGSVGNFDYWGANDASTGRVWSVGIDDCSSGHHGDRGYWRGMVSRMDMADRGTRLTRAGRLW